MWGAYPAGWHDVCGVAPTVRAVDHRLSCIEQLGWVRSAVTVACATPSPVS
jgi:hypothetical protein